MATTLSTERTKELLTRLISDDYEKIDFEMDYIYGKADELIALALSYGLNDQANAMISSKNL